MFRSQLFLALALAAVFSVSGEKAKAEEPLAIQNFFDSLQARVQNATATLESVLGVDIPTTQDEVKAALQENLNGLKVNAEKIQKKLAEYNVSGSSVQGMLEQVQTQVNKTVEDLAKRNPDLGKLLEQVKKGYEGLAEVSKQVGGVVQDHATAAGGDLKTIVEQAKTELTKTATQLEAKVQEVLQEKPKKSKTA